MLRIPPLRDRREDLEDLTQSLLETISENNNIGVKHLSTHVNNLFHNYQWPGNVRELKNVLLYAATISQNDEIKLEDLPPGIEPCTSHLNNSLTLVQQKEKELIYKTLLETKNNKSETAKFLNMSRNTLYLKLKKYGIA